MVTFVFPFQASSNHVPAEVQRSPICFIYGFAPRVMCRDFGREAHTNEPVFSCMCVFFAPRTCHGDNNQPFFKPCSPLTITPLFLRRQLLHVSPSAFPPRRRQCSIILPLPVAPTKDTSQAHSRGESMRKQQRHRSVAGSVICE